MSPVRLRSSANQSVETVTWLRQARPGVTILLTMLHDAHTVLPEQPDTTADYAMLLSGDRLLAVAEFLIRSPIALSARAISEATGIQRSTTDRVLNTLMHRGWVERQPSSADYRLSVKFLALAHVAPEGRSILHEVRPALVVRHE